MPKRMLVVTAAVILSLVRMAGAVEPGEPSKTAIMAAIFRAIGARNPDAVFRNPDFLAGKFLRDEDLTLLARAGADYRPQMRLSGRALAEYLRTSRAVTTNFVRTVHIDRSMLDAAAAGAAQVVVLGAGLDSRAYRFANSCRESCSLRSTFRRRRRSRHGGSGRSWGVFRPTYGMCRWTSPKMTF
jgi:hypothetical protein